MGRSGVVKSLLRIAPVGSPARSFVRKVRGALREARLAVTGWTSARVPFDDLHEARQWRVLLAANHVPWLRDAPDEDEVGAAGFVLTALLAQRGRFARALSAGVDGPFARWLLAGGATPLSARAAANVRAVFAAPPGARVLRHYDADLAQRAAHPLALTAAGRVAHLRWLLVRQRVLGRTLEAHHLLWFVLANAEDESAGVVPTYLRQPAWQRAVPDGLGAGFARLRAWVHAQCAIDMPAHVAAPSRAGPWQDFRGATDRPNAAPIDGVNVIAHLRYTSGLAAAAKYTIRAAQGAGLQVSQRDVPVSADDASDAGPDRSLGLETYPVSLVAVAPGDWTAECYERAGLWRRPDIYRIGIWYWELATGDPAWRAQGDYLDEIWCPTTFIADSVRRVMRVPVTPMLPGIELPSFEARSRDYFGLPKDRFLFLFMFDMHSFFERKNPLAVVRAYREAFAAHEPVGVVIKVNHGPSNPAAMAALQAEAARGGVTVLAGDFARADTYALIACCDAYVSLHRSEGYGLTLAEAMALGKPAIATRYSGNLDFMSGATSKLVGYDMTPVGQDLGPYRKDALWAEPRVSEAAKAMRWVVDQPAAAAAMGRRAQESIARVASLDAYGQRIAKRLAAIGALREWTRR